MSFLYLSEGDQLNIDDSLGVIFSDCRPVAYLLASKTSLKTVLESKKQTNDGSTLLVDHIRSDVRIFGSSQDWGCVIDTPAIPLLDLDVLKNAEILLEKSYISPSTREKPIFSIIRGIGTGKTRLLEELRR